MSRLGTITLRAMALLALTGALRAGDAVAEQKSLQEQLVGTWTYVSVDIVRPDGTRVPLFGPDPSGFASFNANGRYVLLTARSGLPKFASNNRNEGTAKENRTVVQGTIAHFGRYTVDEADKTLIFYIETSTFPNWNGAEQRRPFSLTANELKWTTAASSGGTAEVVLKRVQ
jgi:hypothetical protein